MLRWIVSQAPGQSAILVDAHGRASSASQRLTAQSITLAAAVALTAATPTDNLGSSFAPVRDAAAAAVAGAADAIAKRSPGVRRIIGWIKGRPIFARPAARAAPRIKRPTARASTRPPLPALLTPPPAALPLTFGENDLTPAFAAVGPFPAYDLTDTEDFAYIRLPEERGPGLIIGGIGGGSTGPGPGGLLPPPRPPAIPEASTWAMMILGFGAIGTLWRRRRRIWSALVLRLPAPRPMTH